MFNVPPHLKRGGGGTASLKSWVVANVVDHHNQSISQRSNHQVLYHVESINTAAFPEVYRNFMQFHVSGPSKNNPTNQLSEEYHTTHSHRIDVDETDILHITEHWGTYVQPLMQWKSNEYYIIWVCICSLSYPACNVHAPYCHLWPARLYNIFPHHLTKARFLGGKKKVLIEH